MFLIVFSLIVGFLGNVYALFYYPSEPFPSYKSVPTVLKISGNLNLNTTCTDCNLVVSVLNKDNGYYTVVKNIHATDAQTIINDLNSGIFTNTFGYRETGKDSQTIPVKVDVLDAGTSLVSTSVDLQNPSYGMGFLIADTVAYGGITRYELHDQSVGWIALDTNNVPHPGEVLSYYSRGQLVWIDFLSMISNGSINNNMLADNSITSDKILDSTIVGNDIANNTISANKIQIETPSGQCPVNDANLQWDATNKMFKWDATTYCSVQSVSLITITPIPQDLNEQVTVVSDPSVATQNGTCVWRIGTGPQNNWSTTGLGFSYTYTDPSNPCAGITVDTSKFPVGSTVGVGIDLTYGVSTKSAIGSFYVDNPTKPATCYDSYGNATICP